MKYSTRIACLLLACWAGPWGSAGHAQERPEEASDQPVLEEHVRVALRLVDFLVIGKNNLPVTDLRPDEVELFDGGDRQEILDFYPAYRRAESLGVPPEKQVVPEGAEQPTTEKEPTDELPGLADGRWIVLLFDARNLSYQGRSRSGTAARELVEQNLSPGDRVCLIVDDDELRVVTPFTTNHDLIVEYLRQPEGLSARYRDIERLLRDLRDDTESCREASDREHCARVAASSFVFEVARDTEASLEHLEALLRGLAAIPDRKIVFYFSEGFLANPGDVASAAVQHAIGQLGYNVNASETFMMRDYRHRLDPIYQLATRARVGLYTVNTIRRMTDDVFSAERPMEYGPENLPQSRTDPFEATWQQVRKVHSTMAYSTGAIPVFRRDPTGLLGKQLDSSAGVYTLSYQPSSYSWNRRKIKIKVSRKKTRVYFRNRYNFVADQTRRLDGELVVEPSPEPGGFLSAELRVLGADFKIAPESEPPVSVVSLFFEVRDGQDEPVRDLYETIAFPRDPGGGEEARLLRRPFALRIPAGDYTLRVDVSDVNGPGRGSFSRSFTVPDKSAGTGSDP